MVMELNGLHHHHISILGFNDISSWALQKLLLHFTRTFLPTYHVNDTPEEATSKAFTYLKDENSKTFNLQHVFTNPPVREILFDEMTKDIKKEIKPDALDVDLMINTLQHIKCFPTANVAYRKYLACTSKNHQFCCKNCKGQHKCSSCGRAKCTKSCKNCNSGQPCNHVCNHCPTTQSDCSKTVVVCCNQCKSCLGCAKL